MIKIDANVHVHNGDVKELLARFLGVQGDLASLLHAVSNLAGEVIDLRNEVLKMSTAIDRLEAVLNQQTTVVAGVEQLMARLIADVRGLFPDSQKAQALMDRYEENTARLAAAVAAGTTAADQAEQPAPGDPVPTPAPAPEGGSSPIDPVPTPAPEPDPEP